MPKPKKKQPNLARAERALSRLVDGAASEDGPSDDRDFTASAFKQKGKRSKLSRKEQRKQDRAAKKQASLKHFQKKGDVGKKSSKKKGKDKAVTSATAGGSESGDGGGSAERKRKRVTGGEADAPAEDGAAKRVKAKGAKGQKDSKKGRRGEHSDRPDANPLFTSLLREQGLVADGDGGAASVTDDPDDVEMRRMRKLLKMKADEEMLRDEGDGLDFLLGFEEDAAEAARAAGVTLPSGPARPDGDESESDLDTEVLGPVDELPSEDDDEALGGLSSEGEDAMSEDEPGFGEIEVDADSDIGGLAGDFDGEMDGEFGSEGESEGGSESEEGSDEDEGDEEAANVEPAMYISRAEAYGDQAAGKTDKAKAIASAGKYVPPSQRAAQRGVEGSGKVIQRQIKGLMNRMNEENFISILRELDEVFARNGRGEVVGIVTTFVLDACMNRAATLRHLLMVYGACIAALHHTVGMEVTAHFVHAVATQYEAHYTKLTAAKAEADAEGGGGGDEAAMEKQCANLAAVLSYLYICKAVHSTMLMDILRRHLDVFGDADVELILVILQAAGHRLRSDDTEQVKALFQAVTIKAGAASSTKPRVRFMIDAIADLDRKRMKIVKDTSNALVTLQQATRTYAQGRKHPIREPLRVPWADLLAADTSGRWWLVGSAWVGRDKDAAVLGAGVAREAVGEDADKPTDALVEAARRQRMNTDTRRKVFYVIMGSEDYLDAFEKLSRLALPAKQDREIIRVLVECFLQTKAYNPYFAVLTTQLCKHNHNHKFTLQYTLWDRFKVLEDMTIAQASLLARFVAHLIAHFALSLAILKVVEFNTLKGHSLVFFQLLFVTLLTHYDEVTVSTVLTRVTANRELSQLRNSAAVFLRHYVKGFTLGIGDGGHKGATGDKAALLAQRIKLAKRCLARSDHDLG